MEALIIISIPVYFLRFLFYYIGAGKQRDMSLNIPEATSLPFVSVIIPSRNEEKNIAACLESFIDVDYPTNKFEIIAINDRSSDNTPDIIESFKEKLPNLILLNLTEDRAEKNLFGKPGALDAGINAARGEFVLMTDADCTVSRGWIKNLVTSFIKSKADIIPSFTLVKGNSLFEKVQSIEWIFLETMAAGAIGMKRPQGCFGNNLSIRKSKYDELGGYSKIKFSVTEDLALLKAVFQSGGNTFFSTNPNTTVETLPVRDFSEYLSQHRRWAIGGKDLGWDAAFFLVSNILIWIGIVAGLITGNYLWALSLLLFRLLADSFLILPTLLRLKQLRLIPWIFPSVLFFMIMELVIPFLVIDNTVKWKGQVFRSLF